VVLSCDPLVNLSNLAVLLFWVRGRALIVTQVANRNTRRQKAQRAKEILEAHRDGIKVSPAPSQRRSKWRPALTGIRPR
jgi:hypothetical protein